MRASATPAVSAPIRSPPCRPSRQRQVAPLLDEPDDGARPGQGRAQLDAPPADPTDGTTVYAGTGTSVTDTGLTNGTLYYYGVWTIRGGVRARSRRARRACPSARPAPTRTRRSRPATTRRPRPRTRSASSSTSRVDKALLKLGRVYKAGSTAGNQIGVWDATTGAPARSATVTPAAPVATLATRSCCAPASATCSGSRRRPAPRGARPRASTGLPSYLVVDDTAFSNDAFSYPDTRDNQTAPDPGRGGLDDDLRRRQRRRRAAPDPVTNLQAAASRTAASTSPGRTRRRRSTRSRSSARRARSPTDPTDGTIVFTGHRHGRHDYGLTNGTQVYNYAVWTVTAAAFSTPARSRDAMPGRRRR